MSRSVEQWIEDAIVNGSYQRFDDLHVDEIDPRYRDRRQWVSGASQALEQAAAIRDEKNLPFTIAVGIALRKLCTGEVQTVGRPFQRVHL